MALRHIVITRFNLATPGREVAFRTRAGWLEGRFALFERYCLPSVAAQQCKDFDWLIFFDDQTPDWARAKVEELRRVRAFDPCYTAIFDSQGWARAVRSLIGPPQPGRRLLTSNLDNDDALAFDYTARVRAAADAGPVGRRFAINVPNGFVMAESALYAHHHLQNAFTNLVESDDAAFATTMTIRHMELSDHVPVVQAEGPGGWLQIVHEANVSNRVRGRRVATAEARERFPAGVVAQLRDPSAVTTLAESLIFAPARAIRDRLYAALRRIVRVD